MLRLRSRLGLSQQRALLGAGPFRRLFLARAGSEIGNWLAWVALVVAVYEKTGSTNWVAALTVAQFLPGAALGLAAGYLVDLWPRRRLLIASDLVNVAVFCALPFVGGALPIVLLVFVSGIASAFFRPAVYAALPTMLAGDERLVAANSLLSASEQMANLAGPVLSGLLIVVAGSATIYLANAATFLFSAVMVLTLAPASLQGERVRGRGRWAEIKPGLAVVVHSRQLKGLLATWGLVGLFSATLSVSTIVLAKHDLHGGNLGYGFLMAANGAGMISGALLAGAVAGSSLARVYRWGIFVLAAGCVACGLSPSVWLAVIFGIGLGLGNALALVCCQALVQRRTPVELRGRVFVGFGAVIQLVLVLGNVFGGPLAGLLGGRAAWVLTGLVIAVAGLLSLVLVTDEAANDNVDSLGVAAPALD